MTADLQREGSAMTTPNAEAPERRLLTRKEVAAYLRCGETKVKELTAQGELDVAYIGPQMPRYPLESVQAYVDRRLQAAKMQPSQAEEESCAPREIATAAGTRSSRALTLIRKSAGASSGRARRKKKPLSEPTPTLSKSEQEWERLLAR